MLRSRTATTPAPNQRPSTVANGATAPYLEARSLLEPSNEEIHYLSAKARRSAKTSSSDWRAAIS